MDFLSDFPYELIREVSQYLGYSDIQSWRVSCRRISKILEPLALVNLTVDLDKFNHDDCLDVPLDKYRAYAEPYGTKGAEHVRHLTIHGLCVNFSTTRCSYEHETGCDQTLLKLKHPYKHREVIYRRIKLFFEVMDKFFVSPAFNNLETIRWEVPPCDLHEFAWEGECSTSLQQLMPLILRDRKTPLRRFEFLALDDEYLPKFPALPLCKELYLRGMPDYRSSAAHNAMIAEWLEETIFSIPTLESLDWDMLYTKKAFEYLVKEYKGSSVRDIQHGTLMLSHWGGRMGDALLAPFRNLKCLHLQCDEPRNGHMSSLLCEETLSPLWLQLVEEQIFVEELGVFINQAGESFIDYLSSYPSPTLQMLLLRCTSGDYYGLDVIPGQFYNKALPVIAPGLKEFNMKTDEINNWCFGVLPDSHAAYQKCTALESLIIVMEGREDLEDHVRSVLSGLPLLNEVEVRVPVARAANSRSPPETIYHTVQLH